MSNIRFRLRASLIMLGLIVLLMGVSAAAAETVKPITRKTFGWKLTSPTIIEGGRATETNLGWYVHDYSVQAFAGAVTDATPVKSGWFTFKGTIFSPRKDRPGQKAGLWYLHGGWKIIAVDADPKVVQSSLHNSYLVEGDLSAETAFNPAEQPREPLTAKVMISGNQAAGRWTNGGGTFSGTADLEGTVTLYVEQRPDLAKPKDQGKTK